MDVSLLEFEDGHAARVARPYQFADVAAAVAGLGLRGRRPVLVMVGGAAGLDEVGKKRLSGLFGHILLPVVVSRQAVVVDGGTDSGVMQLVGRARAEVEASFPLVGVAAEKTVILPGDHVEPGDRAPLERNHSHFVLVPGSSWGDESPWLSWVATVIAGGAPSATILINGGEIAFQDVAHSLEADRPILAIAGTGRTADRIAAAVSGDHTDERAARLAGSPLVTAVSWVEDPAAVGAAVDALIRPAGLRPRPHKIVLHGFHRRSKTGLPGQGYTGHTGKTVYVSGDLGATWKLAGHPASAGDGGMIAAAAPGHLTIATMSAASWLYGSADNGRTWRTVVTYPDGGQGWNDLGFTTTDDGLVIHGHPSYGDMLGQLLLTGNGGLTWHAVRF